MAGAHNVLDARCAQPLGLIVLYKARTLHGLTVAQGTLL